MLRKLTRRKLDKDANNALFAHTHAGLANGGLLRFASDSTSNNSFSTAIDAAGFQSARGRRRLMQC
jgi:hypothetical protein